MGQNHQNHQNHQSISSRELLELLATQGMSALDVPTDHADPADLDRLFCFARFQGVTDLRDSRMELPLNRVSCASLALALGAFFTRLDNVREMARMRGEYLRDRADALRRRTSAQERAVARMNAEQDRADFLCGTGFDARCAPPATTRAIDAAIAARAQWEAALDAYTDALRASEQMDAALVSMEREAALVRVGAEGATAL